jgi:hypothetical protein
MIEPHGGKLINKILEGKERGLFKESQIFKGYLTEP